MKKFEREIKIGDAKAKASMSNEGDGCFTDSILAGDVGDTGTGTLKMKLEDNTKKKYEAKDLPVTIK